MRAHQRKENTQCNTIYARYTHCDYSPHITIYTQSPTREIGETSNTAEQAKKTAEDPRSYQSQRDRERERERERGRARERETDREREREEY